MLSRVVLAVAALAVLVATPAAHTAAQDGSFFLGFAEDLPKETGAAAVGLGADLGATSFRITTLWTPGQTQPTAEETAKLDRAVAAASGMRLILSVFADAGSKAPTSASARDEYCGFVRTVLARYPSIRDVAVWNEPNKSFFWSPQLDASGAPASPRAYAELLARCYDVLHAAYANVNVLGLALSSTGNDNAGSQSPGAFIRGVGDWYRASGRTRPILDTVAYHPYGVDAAERPWRKHIASKVIAQGDWNKLMYNLWIAFDGTAQPIPGEAGVTIWYVEAGFQTGVPAERAGAYSGTENVGTIPDWAGGEPESPAPAETSAAPDQATQARDAIRLAFCQPYVGAFLNFMLVDEPRLAGWQSGPYWADGTAKASAPMFRDAIAEARAGTVDCGALKGGRPSADYLPPAAPANLRGAAAVDPLRVDLAWDAASDDTGAASYRVYRNGTHVGNTTGTTWTNTAVASGATYTYTVRALDAAANLGEASAPVTVTTPDTVAPSTPTDLTAVAKTAPGRVELAWTASTDAAGVTGYEITRDGVVLATVTATAHVDTAVTGTTTYGYALVALDAAGNRSPAATVSVTTPDLTAPTRPTGLRAGAFGDRVELTWDASTDDVGVAGYDVLRNGTVLATAATPGYVDAAVAQGATYAYEVRARDAAGNVGAGATISVTVPDTAAPTAPPELAARALRKPIRVALSWGAATDNVGVTVYRVSRNGALVWQGSGSSFTDANVARSTTYRYDVRAVDAAGNAGPASTVSVTTVSK